MTEPPTVLTAATTSAPKQRASEELLGLIDVLRKSLKYFGARKTDFLE